MDLSSFYRKNVKVDGSISPEASDDGIEENKVFFEKRQFLSVDESKACFDGDNNNIIVSNNSYVKSVVCEIPEDVKEMMTDDSTDVSKYGSFIGNSDIGKEDQSSDQFDFESVGESGATENETADYDSDNQTTSDHPVVKVKTLVEYHLEFLTKHPGEVFFYGCRLCAHRFTSRNSFLIHMKLHNVRKRYPCDFCDKAYDRKFQLVHHLRLHTNETPFECEVCFIAYATEEELLEHSRIHTSDKPFECRYCLKGFPQKKALIVHLRMHTGERPFPCQFCDRTFTQKAHLQGHMVRIHIPKKEFVYQRSTNNTEMQSAADKAVLNLFTQKKNSLFNNSEITIDSVAMDSDFSAALGVPREKLIECEYCDKKFTYERNKTNHMKKHGGEPQYECDSCRKPFPTRSSLAAHLPTHSHTSTGSPFRCDICGREFNMKRNLIMHVKSHNNERPFECPACEKSFKLKYFLELHVTRIHPHIKYEDPSPKKETAPAIMKDNNILNMNSSMTVSLVSVNTNNNAKSMTMMQATPNKRKQSQPKKVIIEEEDFDDTDDGESSYGEYSSDSGDDMQFDVAKYARVIKREGSQNFKRDSGDQDAAGAMSRSMQINLPHDLQHVKKLLNAKMPSVTVSFSEPKSTFACPLCALPLANRMSLAMHLKEHDKSRPHQCTMCDKVYIQQASFEKHMKKHMMDGIAAKNNTKLLEQVGNAFKNSGFLPQQLLKESEDKLLEQQFKMLHDEKKPLECKICKKKYAQPASFEKHMRQHSELGEGNSVYPSGLPFSKVEGDGKRSASVSEHSMDEPMAESGFINPSDFLEVSIEHS